MTICGGATAPWSFRRSAARGQPSRTEIAAATGLSHSTISTISSDLIAEGILAEAKSGEPASLKRGRPQVALALDPKAAAIVAVVLSLNFLSAAVIDYAGNTIVEEQRQALDPATCPPRRSSSECVGMVRQLVRRVEPSRGARPAHRAGRPGHHRCRLAQAAVVADHAA